MSKDKITIELSQCTVQQFAESIAPDTNTTELRQACRAALAQIHRNERANRLRLPWRLNKRHAAVFDSDSDQINSEHNCSEVQAQLMAAAPALADLLEMFITVDDADVEAVADETTAALQACGWIG